MGTRVTRAGLEEFKQVSASASLRANVSTTLVDTKEGGTVLGERESPQPEGEPPSLVAKPLPGFETLKIDFALEQAKGRPILVCFWDMQQRPSRNCLRRLSKRAQELEEQDVIVLAVQASRIDESALGEWVKDSEIAFAVGMVEGDVEKTRFSWGVRSLPWLVLTDRKHIVRAEGIGVNELDERIGEMANVER
jgi:hypothetical protein